ncbi:beta-lactamase family protein [Rhodoferax sp. AJA081-3]|uniref:serine hydrolase domain-containing protein n=1 Tax=Rhodoferax sp. AJA081-3 TaxID=2752316 RepID=UPI001AE076A9|nr:serine hydrolase domain-containing protein [Rhodoferax sp. AJA081-3]QTN28854.1 beta-lactamase family protein [Rhodoferax sp. AJA081-3]
MVRKTNITLCTLIALASLLAPAVGAQGLAKPAFRDITEPPQGKLGEQVAAMIAAINANDPKVAHDFVERYLTPSVATGKALDARAASLMQAFRSSSGVDFYSVRAAVDSGGSPHTVNTVVLKERLHGGWMAAKLVMDPGNAPRIRSIAFDHARPPASTSTAAMTEVQMLERVNASLDRECANDKFSGALLIARADQVLLKRACGEASMRYHVKNDVDTKFNLGSMNKMFTAVAIAQLVEQGRVSYDDPVSKYVDKSWLPKRITDRITVHHLLTHTSGLGSYFNDKFENSSRELFREVNDFKPLLQGDDPSFPPGQRFQYSNSGMLLLGVVIEKASGKKYFDYVREHIFKPAGMKDTDSYAMDEPVENLAMGYTSESREKVHWKENTFMHVIKGGPAGGGFSTVGDLHRFAQALQVGNLVNPESRARLWTNQSDRGYGYGFKIGAYPNGLDVGHNGGFPGISGDLTIFVDQGYVVAVLSNRDHEALVMSGRLRAWITQIPAAD